MISLDYTTHEAARRDLRLAERIATQANAEFAAPIATAIRSATIEELDRCIARIVQHSNKIGGLEGFDDLMEVLHEDAAAASVMVA